MTVTAVAWYRNSDRTPALHCACRLSLPLVEWPQAKGLVLLFNQHRVGLALAGQRPQPVHGGWGDGPLRRRLHQSSRKDALLRACSLERKRRLNIVDATGGFGRDAWLLASSGARVKVVERNPVVAWLLQHSRAEEYGRCRSLAECIEIHQADAAVFLRQMEEEACDIVYLDPMFPVRRKKLKNSQRIELLRAVTRFEGSNDSLQGLLELALRCARHRVVLKRPRGVAVISADSLKVRCGFYSLTGSSSRFDVYTRRSLKRSSSLE